MLCFIKGDQDFGDPWTSGLNKSHGVVVSVGVQVKVEGRMSVGVAVRESVVVKLRVRVTLG